MDLAYLLEDRVLDPSQHEARIRSRFGSGGHCNLLFQGDLGCGKRSDQSEHIMANN
jgi:hypothetical protein